MNYRLYSFVANHYLSPLQCGLQTAHVVSELSLFKCNTPQVEAFSAWARDDKTIIICGAGNHQGVVDCFTELARTALDPLGLPVALFKEDEQSMNGMATACGVIVPQKYWDVVPLKGDDGEIWAWRHSNAETYMVTIYPLTHPEGQFIDHIKQYRLA